MRPAPGIATCTYYAGIDPSTKKPVKIARNLRDRKLQRTLIPLSKPEYDFEVREALGCAGRADLIGGCDGHVPPTRLEKQSKPAGTRRMRL